MIEARRRAYLEALGYDVWIARPPAAERGSLGVGAGRGSTLLVCPCASDCETELARDLVRALGGDPVWAWLDPSEGEEPQVLEDVISSRLITQVVLFGRESTAALFQGEAPEIVGSARLTVAPSLRDLVTSGIARKSLWQMLRDAQHAAGRGGC